MRELTHKLHITDNDTFESIMAGKDNGDRFVFYEYLVPRPLFPPVRIPSKIFYIKNGDTKRYYYKYNILVALLGWWGLPFGPMHTIAIFTNNLRGNDVTDDVYQNLTPEGVKHKKVVITSIATVFGPLDREMHKELSKCLRKFAQTKGAFVSDPVVGVHIDSQTQEIYIGLDNNDMPKCDTLLKEVYKYFYKHTKFKCIAKNDAAELSQKLKEQGTVIHCK